MANPFYQAMGGNQPNIMQMLGQIKQNPIGFLAQRKLNIPQNMANDPNAIINYLLSSGQINQDQVNQAYQIAQRWGK